MSRVGACVRYADRYDRTVIVETDFSSAEYFRDRFDRYFISYDSKLVLDTGPYVALFDNLTCEPRDFQGRVNSYSAEYNNELEALAETSTSLIPQFDFRRNHRASLLLHHSVGGSMRTAKIALQRLSVTPAVRAVYEERKARLGDSYAGIHIRHTDYNTDYRSHILTLKDSIKERLYVATDNRNALAYCEEIFGPDRVYNFSALPEQAGQNLHGNIALDAWRNNLDALVDLLLLASAKSFYFFPLAGEYRAKPRYSGFSLLANLLHDDKRLLSRFVDPDTRGAWTDVCMKGRKLIYRLMGKFAR